ncbi:MAG: FAD-dependent oxidoreductase [Acidimicrobiia bacterium]
METDGRGHIVVDDRMATTNPRVFAAGDVTTLPQVHVAALSGARAPSAVRAGGNRLRTQQWSVMRLSPAPGPLTFKLLEGVAWLAGASALLDPSE